MPVGRTWGHKEHGPPKLLPARKALLGCVELVPIRPDLKMLAGLKWNTAAFLDASTSLVDGVLCAVQNMRRTVLTIASA